MPVRVSERTEKLKTKLFWLRFADLLMLITPFFYYFVSGLVVGEAVVQKIALVSSVMIAAVVCVINVIFKYHLRSPLWIALIGIHVAIGNVLPLLIITAVFSVVDEFFLTPWIKKTKVQLITSKEIDQRVE